MRKRAKRLCSKREEQEVWKVLNNLEGELYVAGFKKKQLADYWGVKPATVTKVFKGANDISFGYLSKTLILLKRV